MMDQARSIDPIAAAGVIAGAIRKGAAFAPD